MKTQRSFTSKHDSDKEIIITIRQGSKTYYITGRVRSKSTGITEKQYKTQKKTRFNAEIDITVEYVRTAIEDKIANRNGKKKESTEGNDGSMIYETFCERREMGGRLSPNMNEDTTKRAFHDFERVYKKHLKNYDESNPITEIDKQKIFNELVDEIRSSNRSKNNIATMEQTASQILFYANEVYQCLRNMNPMLPEMNLSMGSRGKGIKNEQLKTLPDEVRQKLCHALEDSLTENPAFVKAAVCMMMGMRTSEAAAVISDDFTAFPDWCIIDVLYQIKKGERSAQLKTKNSYRRICGPKWHTEMLKDCFCELDMLGEGGTVSPSDVSAWVLKILQRCGCSEEYLTEAQKEMPREERESLVDSLAAYILRRDFASLAKNVFYMSEYQIDYLLGHVKNVKLSEVADLKQPENLRKMALQMERYAYSSEKTLNPAYQPILLSHGSDVEGCWNTANLENNTGDILELTIEYEAALPAQAIEIVCAKDSNYNNSFYRKKHRR